MEIIRIDSDQINIGKVGKAGEHNDTTLIFVIPDELLGYKIYDLEFQMASGRKIVVHNIKEENGELSISLEDHVLEYGKLYVEIVGYKFNPDIITKSNTYVGFVERGINAAIEEIYKKASLVAQLYEEIEELKSSIEGGGSGSLPVAYINDDGELVFELGEGIKDAVINDKGELELILEMEDGDQAISLGKVKGRTPYFRLQEKILEIKYDDEEQWSQLVDFSTIASTFDLRLNEETFQLEAQRETGGEWEPMVDLSALKLAHDHANKEILDKITNTLMISMSDAINKKHAHQNFNILEEFTEEDLNNLSEVPQIKEDVEELINKPTQALEKQLVEGIIYTSENSKGLSTNKGAAPTNDFVWIEGFAANPLPISGDLSSATLKVVTTTSGKSSTTTITIELILGDTTIASSIYNKITTIYPYMTIVFQDTSDKTFYVKVASDTTLSGSTISVKFTFIDGKETFPVTGNITRSIQSVVFYTENGKASHTEGIYTIPGGDGSHVQGKFNIPDTDNKYAHIIGNGTDDENRSNAHTVDWSGNAWYAGVISSESVITKIPDLSSKTLISQRQIEAGITSTPAGFTIIPNTYYLVIINNINYVCFCNADYSNSYHTVLGDKDKYGFEIIGTDSSSTTNIYFRDNVDHDFSIYEIETTTSVNLISYIDELKSRIEVLEEKQQQLE